VSSSELTPRAVGKQSIWEMSGKQTNTKDGPARSGSDGMSNQTNDFIERRRFLAASAAVPLGVAVTAQLASASSKTSSDPAADNNKSLIAITFALEMSRDYPHRGMTEWDYEKGNLNAETKQYTLDACRQVKAKGGRIHCFAVGRVFEQKSIDWLKEIVKEGHPVGNHTYDHVYILSKSLGAVQKRFRRAPWLISGKTPAEAIAENIRLCELAIKERLGIRPAGFLAPGNFDKGLTGRPDVQKMLLSLGYSWAGTRYPKVNVRSQNLSTANIDAIVSIQRKTQPFVYSSGLVEVSGYPPTDVHAFRSNQWKLDEFLQVIKKNVQWAIDNRAMYKLALHPSIMYVEDPEFKTVNLVCDLVNAAGNRAAIVDLGTFARRAKLRR